MTDTDLRSWAESHATAGSTQARHVIALLAERDALLAAVRASETSAAELAHLVALKDAIILALSERIDAQAQLLARRAQRP